jgi:ATP-dependent RNA helicase RhlB
MKFTDLDLDARLVKAVEEAGFTECFPVQEETFKCTLSGQDVTVQSQTGSGKTAAFLVTIFQQLCSGEKYRGRKALVIVPTRELATQIEEDAQKLGRYLPYKIGSFFGGIGYGKQEALLREGVDILIGTPGRLIDFSHQKKINLQDVGILVIDEADRLFDMGFLPDLRKLLRKMPPAQERLTMLLSATLGLRVSSLAWEYMNGAREIEIHPEHLTVETITQELYHVSSAEKMPLFLGILKRVNPKNAIIFTNTKHAAEEVCKRMEINGYKSQFIIGDLPQKKRLRIIDDMKEGAISFLVATDVAARGLHVEDLDLVVNYDVPEDAENYVHRIGRTARVGKSGLAVTLACEKYVFGLEAIEKYIDQKIPVQSFTEKELVEDKSAGMRIRTGRYGRDEDDRGRGRGGSGRDRGRGFKNDARQRRKPAGAAAAEKPAREVPAAPAGEDRKNRTSGDAGGRRLSGKKMNREERLAFYRDKYGEEFGGSPAGGATREDRSSPKAEGKKSGRRDRGEHRDRGERRDRGEHRDKKYGGQEKFRRDRPQERDKTKGPEHASRPEEKEQTQSQKKPGVFGKIIGFFRKKG